MSENMTPATQPFTQELISVASKLPPAQACAWLGLAVQKNELAAILQKMELECQGFLLPVTPPAGYDPNADVSVGATLLPYQDQPKVEAAMEAFKAKQKEMSKLRLAFTKPLEDNITGRLMEPEKRMDPKVNEQFITISRHELALRTANQNRINKTNNLNAEKERFRAHFTNEYSAIDVAYRQALGQIIFDTYKMCLQAKTPPDGVPAAISTAKLAMQEVKMGEPARFNRQYMTPEDATAIFMQIPKPDSATALANAYADLGDKFELYSNDLANIPVALSTATQEQQEKQTQQVQELRNVQAANTLFALAAALTVAPDGMKGVTKVTRIKILDGTPDWVLKIIMAFAQNFNNCFVKVRVTKYSSLTVGQMAAALDAAGVKVAGVEYEEIKK